MNAIAAVLNQLAGPFSVESIEVGEPQHGEAASRLRRSEFDTPTR